MISVIICSADKQLLSNLSLNIKESIGVDFEIIGIDNSINQYGICKVYNEGAAKAKFPILCFMHEDISFDTKNWGKLACNHLADKKTGLIGIAGGDTKSLVPSPWAVSAISNEINIIQHDKLNKKPSRHIITTNPKTTGNLKKVVALDGVFLCTKKEIFDESKFDELTFTGFHGYDIDYSLQVNTKYNVFVAFDILIHHYSEGSVDREWLDSTILMSKKWKKQLPVSVYTLSKPEFRIHHWYVLRLFLLHLFRLKYSRVTILKFYLAYSFTRFFSFRRFLSAGKYILVNMFKKQGAFKIRS